MSTLFGQGDAHNPLFLLSTDILRIKNMMLPQRNFTSLKGRVSSFLLADSPRHFTHVEDELLSGANMLPYFVHFLNNSFSYKHVISTIFLRASASNDLKKWWTLEIFPQYDMYENLSLLRQQLSPPSSCRVTRLRH